MTARVTETDCSINDAPGDLGASNCGVGVEDGHAEEEGGVVGWGRR